jgi:hypothetical protein
MTNLRRSLFVQLVILVIWPVIGNARLEAQTAGDSGRVQLPIDWDAARRARETNRERGSATAPALGIDASRLEAIKLPVLVPPSDTMRSAGQVKGQGSAYAASYDLPAAQLSIMGSASALAISPDSTIAPTLGLDTAPDEPLFEPSDDGADLSFSRYGASYVLRISCANADDPRCTRDTFLRSIANSLIVIGGSPQ